MRKFIKTVRDRVEAILQEYPEPRNSDKALFKLYAIIYLGVNEDSKFFDVIYDHELHFETLGRVRRKFQHDGLYESDKQIAKRRAAYEQDFKKEFTPTC